MKEKLFTVLPMSQRFSLEAGHTYQGHITVAIPYDATESFSFVVSVTPFNTFNDAEPLDINNLSVDASDDVSAYLYDRPTYSDIVDWITIENPTGTLEPNGHQVINFTINVPEGVPAGGQYATLLVTQDPEAVDHHDANVSNILALASVIYADVTGVTVRDGSILENTVPGFSIDPHLTLSTAVENRGNTHSDALIIIDITDAMSGEVILPSSTDANKFKEIVLPETIRYINHRIDNLPSFGIFKVTQTVYFNDAVSTTEQNVIICPLWFIFLLVFTIVLIITVIVARVRHVVKKRRNSL